MIDDWDIPARRTDPDADGAQVAVIVPLDADLGGQGEILVFAAFGNAKLPAGTLQPRETSFQAASRIALGQAGAQVRPERLIYVLEQVGKPLTLCVLCSLTDAEEADTKPGVRFVRIASDTDFEPPALRELLIEDAQSGFVRPVAHVVVDFDETGQSRVQTAW